MLVEPQKVKNEKFKCNENAKQFSIESSSFNHKKETISEKFFCKLK